MKKYIMVFFKAMDYGHHICGEVSTSARSSTGWGVAASNKDGLFDFAAIEKDLATRNEKDEVVLTGFQDISAEQYQLVMDRKGK